MSKFGKVMICILVVLAVILSPLLLVLGGVALSALAYIIAGLGIVLLPVIIGVIIGYAIKRR